MLEHDISTPSLQALPRTAAAALGRAAAAAAGTPTPSSADRTGRSYQTSHPQTTEAEAAEAATVSCLEGRERQPLPG